MLKKIKEKVNLLYKFERDIEYMKNALGRLEKRACCEAPIEESEFKVYSQWGEDGIIQHLLHHVAIDNKIFIEFGVEDYTEANTKFLLINNNWSGLIIDGSSENIDNVKQTDLYWRYNLKALDKFVTKENINNIFESNGLIGDIGLLSIDIDGNDYWVWEAISVVSPRIVICEYNSLFGVKRKVTTPYNAEFLRHNYHYSNLVYGASILALNDLAERKGYSLVTGNQAGNNLFFVRDDLMGNLVKKNPEEVYRRAMFREGRNKDGKLIFPELSDVKSIVRESMVYDLEKGEQVRLEEIVD